MACQPSKCDLLSSNPNTTTKKEGKLEEKKWKKPSSLAGLPSESVILLLLDTDAPEVLFQLRLLCERNHREA
jgi:hypothetical protein